MLDPVTVDDRDLRGVRAGDDRESDETKRKEVAKKTWRKSDPGSLGVARGIAPRHRRQRASKNVIQNVQIEGRNEGWTGMSIGDRVIAEEERLEEINQGQVARRKDAQSRFRWTAQQQSRGEHEEREGREEKNQT